MYKGHSYIRYTGYNGQRPARFKQFTLLTEDEYKNLPNERTYPCKGDAQDKTMYRLIGESDLYIIKLQNI